MHGVESAGEQIAANHVVLATSLAPAQELIRQAFGTHPWFQSMLRLPSMPSVILTPPEPFRAMDPAAILERTAGIGAPRPARAGAYRGVSGRQAPADFYACAPGNDALRPPQATPSLDRRWRATIRASNTSPQWRGHRLRAVMQPARWMRPAGPSTSRPGPARSRR